MNCERCDLLVALGQRRICCHPDSLEAFKFSKKRTQNFRDTEEYGSSSFPQQYQLYLSLGSQPASTPHMYTEHNSKPQIPETVDNQGFLKVLAPETKALVTPVELVT